MSETEKSKTVYVSKTMNRRHLFWGVVISFAVYPLYMLIGHPFYQSAIQWQSLLLVAVHAGMIITTFFWKLPLSKLERNLFTYVPPFTCATGYILLTYLLGFGIFSADFVAIMGPPVASMIQIMMGGASLVMWSLVLPLAYSELNHELS